MYANSTVGDDLFIHNLSFINYCTKENQNQNKS